jgi:hypothetical protein
MRALLLASLLFAASGAAAETRVLLTEVPPEDELSASSARTLNRVLEGEVRRVLPDVELVTFRAVRANLEVAEMADCLGDEQAAACATELGNALGVELIAAPRVGRIGSQLVLTLSVYRLGDATVAGQSTRRTDGDEAALLDEARPAVEEAFATTGLRVARAPDAPEPEPGPTIWPWLVGGAGIGTGVLAAAAGLVVHAGAGLLLALPYESGVASRDAARFWEDSAVVWIGAGYTLYGVGVLAAVSGVALGVVME